ncbi:unnamed protein product [Cuscuta europaea]|uniref:Uncharacterized protein n=1 Tax=Cuscuta europaea TaxID=41803 RepID=A0A9P1DY91_CUSEU|nr:unnamed protein product [Cuscuta europaea]
MEEHKWRFLARAIARTGVGLDRLINGVKVLETQARASYSEAILNDKPNEFVEMLVLDGIFVIEILRGFSEVVPFDKDDLLGSMQWMRCRLRDDFLCLENQIPYIVLQKLYQLTEMKGREWLPSRRMPTLSQTALHLFKISDETGRDPETIRGALGCDIEGLHLLDLVRKSYFPQQKQKPTVSASGNPPSGAENVLSVWDCLRTKVPNIRSISKLRRAGIVVKLRVHQDCERSFLPVKFKRGVIWMPLLELDDTMCAILLNFIAFEQCYKGTDKRMSEYVKFLHCLIDMHEDVDLLCEAEILRHHFGSQREVAEFVNRLGMAAEVDNTKSYLRDVYVGVDEHYKNKFHVYLAEVRDTHFRSPWTALSLLAALIVLALTVGQTIYTIYPYYHPHEEKHSIAPPPKPYP